MSLTVSARIEQLLAYPVKGCAGVKYESVDVTPRGLAHDRSFMVVDGAGAARTQRRDPGLAVIRPSISADGAMLTLTRPGADPVTLSVQTGASLRDVWMFGVGYPAIDQGDLVADWLSRAVAAPSRLVRMAPGHDRVTDGELRGTSAFADSCAIHLLAQTSLDEFNRRHQANTGQAVGVDRFRPNVVMSSALEPHWEDQARRIAVGQVVLGFAKPAIRCAVVTVDQGTGVRTGPAVLTTLASYRRSDRGLAFGTKLVVSAPGRLCVGDEAQVQLG